MSASDTFMDDKDIAELPPLDENFAEALEWIRKAKVSNRKRLRELLFDTLFDVEFYSISPTKKESQLLHHQLFVEILELREDVLDYINEDKDGRNILHFALEAGAPAYVIQELIQKCPELACWPDCRGRVALHYTVVYLWDDDLLEGENLSDGHSFCFDTFKIILDAYPEAVTIATQRGIIPLMYACQNCMPEAIEILLDAYPKGLRRRDLDKQLALHHLWKCIKIHSELLDDASPICRRLLKEYPESASIPDSCGCLPLHLLCEFITEVTYDTPTKEERIGTLLDGYPNASRTRDHAGRLPIDYVMTDPELNNAGGTKDFILLAKSYPAGLLPRQQKHWDPRKQLNCPLIQYFKKVTNRDLDDYGQEISAIYPPALLRPGKEDEPIPFMTHILHYVGTPKETVENLLTANNLTGTLLRNTFKALTEHYYGTEKMMEAGKSAGKGSALVSWQERDGAIQHQAKLEDHSTIHMIVSVGRLLCVRHFFKIIRLLSQSSSGKILFGTKDHNSNTLLHTLCSARSTVNRQDENLRLDHEKKDDTPAMDDDTRNAYEKCRTLVNTLLMSYQEGREHDSIITSQNSRGEYPLHIYLKNHDKWSDVDREIDVPLLAKTGHSLTVDDPAVKRDPETGLFPFMLVAMEVVCSKQRKKSISTKSIDLTLELLEYFIAAGGFSYMIHDKSVKRQDNNKLENQSRKKVKQ